jgi:ABC-type polysaccharide/polyol phosphate export permease
MPYPILVLVGNILWNAFNRSLTGSVGIVSEAKGMRFA